MCIPVAVQKLCLHAAGPPPGHRHVGHDVQLRQQYGRESLSLYTMSHSFPLSPADA